ncbi:hypothetical protein OG401_21890 [Kitasatospora purpeofusca]|uniref:hypothetical protein n=1 Tax=Kitasatospora purpeofusca TaxID=67352 RepID=UPI00225BF89C|nr:hypothetical protein [Kitasatospora purpeofusca]MCX4686924.1 hypothetical protein [Kitasatospora purpeofusca]
MDSGVWVGAAAGLVGALVGVGGSIATTLVNQRHQRAEAHRSQRDKLTREAIDAISLELVALEELARSFPEDGASEEIARPYRLTANAHHNRIDMALVRLPDRALAERMADVLWASRLAFQSAEGTHADRWLAAIKVPFEGLSCLGAYLREDSLPTPSRFTQASIDHRMAYEVSGERQSRGATEARELGAQ